MVWAGYVIFWGEVKACIAEALREIKRIEELMLASEESYSPFRRVM